MKRKTHTSIYDILVPFELLKNCIDHPLRTPEGPADLD